MRLTLKEFQERATDKVIARLQQARALVRDSEQVVVLSAATGSGKTVIATSAIETIMFGDDRRGPDERAVFLWITDQPELNEQTRRKMLSSSSKLRREHLVVIEPNFDQETLNRGTVYFLNTQKLASGATLVKDVGDARTHTFWQTVNQTIADETRHLYVVIDEAHRGMAEGTERSRATTILQRFVKGSPEMKAAPIILGITATPQRLEALLEGTERTKHPVTVDVADVRASGLIKDKTTAIHPTEPQTSDMTLLREATRKWLEYRKAWSTYCEREGEVPSVEPLLVIQVEDGEDGALSRTNLGRVIQALRDEVGADLDGLPDHMLAHAFQEGVPIKVGVTNLRYVRPADIEGDAEIAIVLFKSSLNVGWDCPRAEVMMSFRRARDFTNIAQLVGRMVRNPLARRIDGDERLNRVWLYLPHYDVAAIDRVVKYLKETGEAAAASDFETVRPVVLSRRPGADRAFDSMRGLPTYTIPRTRRTTDLRRLTALARALSSDRIEPEAETRERKAIIDLLISARQALADDPAFRAVVEERGSVNLREAEWAFAQTEVRETLLNVAVSDENLDDLYSLAGRRLGDGLHRDYWLVRVAADHDLDRQAKLEVIALATREDILAQLEKHAASRIRSLLDRHDASLERLAERRRQAYQRIKELSASPELSSLNLPDVIDVRAVDEVQLRHLYVDEKLEAPLKLGGWESRALQREVDRPDFGGWLRNIDRKTWALTVPYELDGAWHPLFPDLLIVRDDGRQSVVDILDPHNPELDDAPAKAKGLAAYAREHGGKFGRIELIAEVSGVLKSLDLKDQATRNRVFRVDSPRALRLLYGD